MGVPEILGPDHDRPTAVLAGPFGKTRADRGSKTGILERVSEREPNWSEPEDDD